MRLVVSWAIWPVDTVVRQYTPSGPDGKSFGECRAVNGMEPAGFGGVRGGLIGLNCRDGGEGLWWSAAGGQERRRTPGPGGSGIFVLAGFVLP
jgi:hypothetical protein